VELLLLTGVIATTNPHLVAQAATEAGPWLTGVNLGLAGVFLWAFASGKIVASGTHQREVARADQLEEELRERNREARETLIPALTRATDLLARHIERRVDQGDTPQPPNKRRP
jgi:hypothetical protein